MTNVSYNERTGTMNAKTRRSNRTLRVENLETRKMMATASLSDGVLLIKGGAGNDTIIVRQVDNKISIDNTPISGQGSISKIVVYGYGGNDTIRLDGNGVTGQGVTVRGVVYGGGGADFIVGGGGHDLLSGEDGNDTIYGLGGDDTLYGQGGNDLLFGGSGHDSLYGGIGNDELVGGSNNDELWGGDGYDWLWGNDGDDFIDGGAGLDVAYGGRGIDEFRNLNDAAFFLTHPHLKSPVRGLGDLSNYGVQDKDLV